MDTQTFLNDLNEYAKLYKKSPVDSNKVFDYLDSHYEDYIYATPEERAEIRKFIKGSLFRPKYIAYMLLMYVKKRVLQRLKSTKDNVWLKHGLVALSMENGRVAFYDAGYTGTYGSADASFLLADLYVTAEEKGIDPQPIFEEIAKISDTRMSKLMAGIGIGKLIYERRNYGKFTGALD